MAFQQIFLFSATVNRGIYNVRVSWENTAGTDVFKVEKEIRGGSGRWQTANSSADIDSNYAQAIVAGLDSTTEWCSGTTLNTFESLATFPYAQKKLVANSSKCNADGTIKAWANPQIQVFNETLPNASDGKITIKIQAYYGVKNITLVDFATHATILTGTTGIFEGLPPGEYGFVATDQTDGVYRHPTKIILLAGNFDAYGDFLVAPFADNENRELLLRVRKKGHSGSVRQVCLSGNPITYAYKGTPTDWLFSTIYGYSLDIEFVGEELRDLSVLYTTDDREYLVELQRESVLLFRGYLLPELMRQDYVNGKHYVGYTTTDGLGQLKSYKFLDENGKAFTGKLSLQKVLEICLNKVNIGFKVYNAIKWRFVKSLASFSYAENLFDILYIDALAFYQLDDKGETTCDVVVSEILKPFMARVFQHNGNFLIETPYNYLSENTLLFTGKTENIVLDRISIAGNRAEFVSGATPMLVVSPQTAIEIEPGSQLIRTIADLKPTNGLLPEPDFGKNAYDAQGRLKYWTGDAEYRPPRALTTRAAETFVITYGFTFFRIRTSASQIKWLRCFPVRIEYDEKLLFLLTMTVYATRLNGSIGFKLYIRWSNSYLSKDGTKWLLAPTSGNPPEECLIDYVFTDELYNADQTIEIYTPALSTVILRPPVDQLEVGISEPYTIDASATQQVSLSGVSTGRVDRTAGIPPSEVLRLRNVNVIPLVQGADGGGVALPAEQIRTWQNPLKFTTQSKEIELKLGQRSDNRRNTGLFYPFGFLNKDGNAVFDWAGEDEPPGQFYEAYEKYTLLELTHRAMIKARKVNREVLMAAIEGDVTFFHKILMSKDNNLIYFISELSGEYRKNTHKAKLVYAEGDFLLDRYKQDEITGEAKTDEQTDKPKREENWLYDEEFNKI